MRSFTPFTSEPSKYIPANTFSPLTPANKLDASPNSIHPALSPLSASLNDPRSQFPQVFPFTNQPSPLLPMHNPLLMYNSDLTSFLLGMKMQQNIQSELIKTQYLQLTALQNSLQNRYEGQIEALKKLPMQSNISTVDHRLSTGTPNSKVNEDFATKSQTSGTLDPQDFAETFFTSKKGTQQDEAVEDSELKVKVKEVVKAVLENYGRCSKETLEELKAKYEDDKEFATIFDILMAKYATATKTKEEMIKYVLRRVLKSIKNKLRKEENLKPKNLSRIFSDKYFKFNQGNDFFKEPSHEETSASVLPFRKNSKNKTMNTQFIYEIFTSENFCKDYSCYLKSFDQIMDNDNKGKVDKLASFIEECLLKNEVHKIKEYKRLPWPRIWMINTKKIAEELPSICTQSGQQPMDATKKKMKSDGFSTLSKLKI